MVAPYATLVRLQKLLVLQWVKTALAAADWYAVVLDPRPDLAIPARRIRGGYYWWW